MVNNVLNEPIEIGLWEPVKGNEGYVRHIGNRTVGEVFEELKTRLERENLLPDEYFHLAVGIDPEQVFPEYRWITCFAVTGSSEGHYIHVEAIKPDGKRELLLLGKTFEGLAFAYKVAYACAKHLEA